MEVKFGVIHSQRELVVDTEHSADEVVKLVEAALADGSRVLWLNDSNGRRVGISVDKLTYVEVGEDHPGKRVGFGL